MGEEEVKSRTTTDKLTFEHLEFEVLVRDLDIVGMTTEQLTLVRYI